MVQYTHPGFITDSGHGLLQPVHHPSLLVMAEVRDISPADPFSCMAEGSVPQIVAKEIASVKSSLSGALAVVRASLDTSRVWVSRVRNGHLRLKKDLRFVFQPPKALEWIIRSIL